MFNLIGDSDSMDCEEAPLKRTRIQEEKTALTGCGINIPWPMLYPKPTAQEEIEMEKVLVINRHESGRGAELPVERQQIIEREAHHRGFIVTGAWSLRRQFIRKLARGGGSFFNTRKMGDASEANAHAENFERATESYLCQQIQLQQQQQGQGQGQGQAASSINVLTEEQLKQQRLPMTPDFLFPDRNVQINGVPVNWIDCKTYYGASSLVSLPFLPIGKLKKQCDKYVQAFGPGAVVFLNGFSQDLLEKMYMLEQGQGVRQGQGQGQGQGLNQGQVLLLDAHPLDTSTIFSIEKHTSMVHKEELDCPRHKMKVIIGKKGRTINELMASSGCHIALHKEYQKVVITASSAEQLRDGSDKVQSLLGAGSQPVLTAQVLCPVHTAGRVIGKNGAVVRDLMQRSGCVIKTYRRDVTPDGLCQLFHVTAASAEMIEVATALIREIVEGGTR